MAAITNSMHYDFCPVIKLPLEYPVFDFTGAQPVPNPSLYQYGVGRYLESRPHVYTEAAFKGRSIHMGIDIQAPAGTEVRSFADGVLWGACNHHQPQNYGYTLVIEYKLAGVKHWALYGHLSEASLEGKAKGQKVEKGEVIGWLGSEEENGQWRPHLHFQLSVVEPQSVDMPGVVSLEHLDIYRKQYIDPRKVLGPIY